MSLLLRPPRPADVPECGRILYDAFAGIAQQHNFPQDFPDASFATGLMGLLIQSPAAFGVVAEYDGAIAGSNFLMEADAIRGVGPISVDPLFQGRGVGRQLMQAVLDHAAGAPGVRLVQDGFNMLSLSLYASLGFDVVEPLAMVQGKLRSAGTRLDGYEVRPVRPGDVDECSALCRAVHGFDRANELRHAGAPAEPWLARKGGNVVAYATSLSVWPYAHGVARDEEAMRALWLGFAAERQSEIWLLFPVRNATWLRWCLGEGLRLVKPMNLMALGEYRQPQGCWFPSVAY